VARSFFLENRYGEVETITATRTRLKLENKRYYYF